jgi:hypothetical protein
MSMQMYECCLMIGDGRANKNNKCARELYLILPGYTIIFEVIHMVYIQKKVHPFYIFLFPFFFTFILYECICYIQGLH